MRSTGQRGLLAKVVYWPGVSGVEGLKVYSVVAMKAILIILGRIVGAQRYYYGLIKDETILLVGSLLKLYDF
jgi:hypothetical protein